MKLTVAYWEKRAPKSYFYLLTPGGEVPDKGRWFGIFIHTPAPQDTKRLAYLSHNLKMLQNPMLYYVQSFVFFETGLGGRDVKDIVAGLEAYDWSAIGAATLAWVPDIAADGPVAALPMVPLVDRKAKRFGVLLDAPETRPLVLLDDAAQPASLRLAAAGQAKIEVEANDADDGFVLSCDAGIGLVRGTPGGKPAAPLFSVTGGTAVEIGAGGATAGCLRGAGTLATPVSELLIGLRHDLGERGPMVYPAMNAAGGLDGHGATLGLSPNAVLDPARSAVALDPAGAGFASAFRTRGGGIIALAPDPGGSSRLVFNRGNGAVRYLTLDGAFVAKPPSGAGDVAFLCGLSGVEYIALKPDDRFVFAAGKPAAVTVTSATAQGSGDTGFAADPDGAATTAWMTIRGDGAQPTGRAYFAEPDRSPFFTPGSAGPDPLQLGYMELSRLALAPGDASAFFPAVPYAAMPDTGAGQDPALVRAFELHYLNPARRVAIADGAASGRAGAMAAGGGVSYGVTPQGHKATFENGQWTALDVAAMQGPDTEVAIRFEAAPGAALPDALQDAFLTNQQFMVMTQDKGNLGRFSPTIRMSGWQFDLDLSVNKTVGSYRNVLIFKSASASLAQLAASPQLWTGTAAFNSEADPEGAYLSAWLTAYLNEARRLYDDGRGVASLAAFCRLIDDPDWNGVLALNVGVDPAALAPEIEALLAGIDDSLFAAHHIGNLVNHVAPQTGGDFKLNSSVFGLIHYTDPAYRTDRRDIAYLPTPDDFDFRVLTLEAVFEDARLTHFSNKSLIVANRLFGDRVLASVPAGETARNTLTLIGTYKTTGGVPSYTFATAPGTEGQFFLSGNALDRVTVTKATMSVTPRAEAGSTGYVARFGMWGSLGLLADPVFDLLSFERLAFQNLAIEMRLHPAATQAPGGRAVFDRSFAFRTDGLVFEDLGLRQVDAGQAPPPDTDANLVRKGSLLTAFPLKIKGFRSGEATAPPDSLGYRVLHTGEPAGVASADLDGGPWNALAFEMTLGAKGALAGKAVIAAEVLLAWKPDGADGPDIAPLFKLSGPDGIALSFDIEGVVKFGAKDVVLNKIKRSDASVAPDMFVMIFESIGLSVLMLSFPPAGTTNVYLMGGQDGGKPGDEVNPTLGWVGGYQARDAGS